MVCKQWCAELNSACPCSRSLFVRYLLWGACAHWDHVTLVASALTQSRSATAFCIMQDTVPGADSNCGSI